MKLDLRFTVAATCALSCLAVVLAPLPLFAQTDDDLLRPMIVRPTDSGASSSAASAPASTSPSVPATASAYTASLNTPDPVPAAAPIPAPAPMQVADNTNTNAKLRLPAPPAPSQINLGASTSRMGVTMGRDIFSGFGPSSGSAVSDRVFQLRDEALSLNQSVDKNTAEFEDSRGKGAAGAIQYHSTVAAIQARLEAGTTKGNPILLRQWSEAEQSLTEVNYSISRLNMLSSGLSGNSASAAYLLQAVRAAFELSGALDEDHDQLSMIRDEVAKMAVKVDRLRTDVSEDVNRQNSYLATERRNLQTLALAINRGELIRNSLASAPVVVMGDQSTLGTLPAAQPMSYDEPAALMPAPEAAPVTPVKRAPIRPPASRKKADNSAADSQAASLGQLLVLVRFNQDNVDYEQSMYQAVSSALDRKPDASFTVVAVTPKSDNIGSDTDSAQRHADAVKSSLVQLGLQPSRIAMTSVSSEAATSPEVHVYIR